VKAKEFPTEFSHRSNVEYFPQPHFMVSLSGVFRRQTIGNVVAVVAGEWGKSSVETSGGWAHPMNADSTTVPKSTIHATGEALVAFLIDRDSDRA
jgi:hypothetical protein